MLVARFLAVRGNALRSTTVGCRKPGLKPRLERGSGRDIRLTLKIVGLPWEEYARASVVDETVAEIYSKVGMHGHDSAL